MGDWNINTKELDDLIRFFEASGNNMDLITNKAIDAGVEIVKKEMSNVIPRSDEPRLPDSGIQKFRTGKHAALDIPVSRMQISKDGNKYRVVGSRETNDPYFYVKFFETGKLNVGGKKKKGIRLTKSQIEEWGTSYQAPRPFISKLYQTTNDKVVEAMRKIVLAEMGING